MPDPSDPFAPSPGVTLAIDSDGAVVGASPLACEVLGRPAEEVVGRRLEELVRGDVDELLTSAGAGTLRRELVVETPRGSRALPCEVSRRVAGGRPLVQIVGRDLAGRRILVADDHAVVRSSVERMLARRGATVVLAEDGEQAERCLRATPFDLLVLDVVMPARTGYEVLALARSLLPELPVILMSGDPSGVPDGGLVADLFLDKPFTIRTLDAAVDELLARRR